MGKGNITHKELLTFSNLTNLEWEFVDLKAIKEGVDADRVQGQKSSGNQTTRLTDLLDPENFVRYDAEKDLYSYPYLKGKYGKDTDLSDEEGEEGLKEMRKQAGIAMEYLEKLEAGNEEGAFLKDWEVIYGADKYKIIK